MALYDFRLRFNFAESYRIESNEDKLELLVLDTGEKIRLTSGAIGEPIKNQQKVAVVGSSFVSEDKARSAAEKSKLALLYWSIQQRAGIDFGDGIPRSLVTNAGLEYFQKIYGSPIRNDLHGIDIYEHIDNLKFVSFNAKAVVGKDTQNLIKTFKNEYFNAHHFSDKLLLASEIYASSFFDVSPRSRFITLVTSVEVLSEQLNRPHDVSSLLNELESKVKQSAIEQPIRDSIIGQLSRLNYQSIGEAVRTLIHHLIPDDNFNGKSAVEFFTDSYAIRSELVHEGKVNKSVDIANIANEMEMFVNHLLLAALMS